MSAVGVASIAIGIFVVCSRGPLLVAPAATLHWFKRAIETTARVRMLGVVVSALGAWMIWAGATADSTLAIILTVWGWAIVGVGTPALVMFPGIYREIVSAFLPAEDEQVRRGLSNPRAQEGPPGWRLIGGLGTIVGLILIYFGALAL